MYTSEFLFAVAVHAANKVPTRNITWEEETEMATHLVQRTMLESIAKLEGEKDATNSRMIDEGTAHGHVKDREKVVGKSRDLTEVCKLVTRGGHRKWKRGDRTSSTRDDNKKTPIPEVASKGPGDKGSLSSSSSNSSSLAVSSGNNNSYSSNVSSNSEDPPSREQGPTNSQ